MSERDPYNEAGFADRQAYLADLAESYPPELVYLLADLLGPTEDFDGLVTALEDHDESEDWENDH